MTATEKKAFREAFFRKAGPNLRSALAMIDTIPSAAFYVKDAKGRFVAANRRNLDICGIATEEEIIGLTSADIFPAPLAREYMALDSRVRESGEPAVNVTDSPTGDYSTDRLVKSVYPVWGRSELTNSDLRNSDLRDSYAGARKGAHGGGEGQHSYLRDSYAGAREGAHGGGEGQHSDLRDSYAGVRDGAHGGGEGQHSDLRDSYAGARDGAHGGGEGQHSDLQHSYARARNGGQCGAGAPDSDLPGSDLQNAYARARNGGQCGAGASEYRKSECIGTMCVFYQTPAQEAVPAWHGRLRSLTEWIAAHCEEKITVPDLARRVGTTPKSLESAFRIVLGTSVSGFVATQRLSRARRLLETTDKTIAAIAAECGYCDHSHFIKAFRGRWGRPPGEYRAAIRSVSSEKIHL